MAKNIASVYTKTGLNEASKYYYKIVAVRENGNSSGGDVQSERSENNYGYTKFNTPKVSYSGSTISIPLPKAAVPVSTDYTYHYEVTRKAKGESSYKTVYTGKDVSKQTATDKTAKKDEVYSYIINIVRSDNKTILRSSAFVAGIDMSAPTLKSTDTNSVTVSWKMSTPSTLKYKVYRKEGNGAATALATVTTTSYVDTKAQAGKGYSYYIEAQDSSGNTITTSATSSITHQILPTGVSINGNAPIILTGGKVKLTANITPSNSTNKAVSWSSANTSVATVASDGTVTGVAAGTSVITVSTSNNIKNTITVTVKQDQETCNHQYGDWSITKEANCTENGLKSRTCKGCGNVDEETIPAVGHQYSEEYTVLTEPTCTEDGEMCLECIVCGSQTEPEAISALGHTFLDEWTITKESTCLEEGIQTKECTICHEPETAPLELAEHTYELTAETETTPDGPGSRTYTCKICQDSYTEEYVPEIVEGIIEIGSGAPRAGGTVTIPVRIKENPGIAGFRFSLNYDKSVLTPTAITSGKLINSGTFTSNLEQGIPAEEIELITVYWGNSSNITDDGELFTITFNVDANAAEGSYPVWIEYDKGDVTDEAFDDVMPNIHDNVITIADVIKGDINQDRVVDSLDGVLLSQYLAKWDITFSENQLKAANVFNDSKINSKDGVRLSQILAGYEMDENTSTVNLLSETTTKFIVGSNDGEVGGYIDVPIIIEDNQGIA